MGHTHGFSGNVFVIPDASSSAPYPQELNPWSSSTEEPLHSSTVEKSERQKQDQGQRCQSGQSAKNSVIPSEGDSSKNNGADQQRLQISDLHFDKFPTPSTFACWKIRFKTEVCTCSQFPTEAMQWISYLKSSSSIRGISMPKFEVLDARIASALNKIIHNSHFQKKNQSGGTKGPEAGPFEKLKTVLELYDLEIHQKKLGPDYHRLKTMVKRSIEQEVRNNNFGARNGNYERNAVVKNQGTKLRVQRILGDCWQWASNGQCSRGDNCSFRHDINKRGKITQSNTSQNSLQQNERKASRTRSPRGKSPSGRMSRWPCKDYLRGTCK